MSDFNPRTQTFYLIAADGETQIPVELTMVQRYIREDYGILVNYGVQMGAAFMVILVMLLLTPKLKLIKLSQWVQLSALILVIIRQALMVVWYFSPWNDLYAVWGMDFSAITDSDKLLTIVAEVISVIVAILLQVILGIQAWAMVNLLPRWWKWIIASLSAALSLLVIALRLATGVHRIQAMLGFLLGYIEIGSVFFIVQAVSIFWYCIVFNSKLVIHLVRHRGVLPSRSGLSAIEVLVITNGILMFIPVVFAGLNFGQWGGFDIGSLTQASVILLLPLGTLIAQRLSHKDAYWTRSDWSRMNNKLSSSGGSSRGAPKVGSPAGSAPSARFQDGCSSHVEAAQVHPARGDAIDEEIRRIDNDDVEKGGVRVNREFERREERV